MLHRSAVLGSFLLLSPVVTHADTLFSYSTPLSTTDPQSGAQLHVNLAVSVLIDPALGSVTGGLATVTDTSGDTLASLAPELGVPRAAGMRGYYETLLAFHGTSSLLELNVQGFGLLNYAGSAVCPAPQCFIQPSILFLNFQTPAVETFFLPGGGQLAPAASPVPEPSTLALLGTGLAVIAARRPKP